MGHWCWVCERVLPNEKFSGKGYKKHICKKCGKYFLTTPGRISVRSLLFALKKAEIVTDDKLKELNKSWKKYRKTQNLDPYGKKVIIPNTCKKQT
jgi:hypothetical protein